MDLQGFNAAEVEPTKPYEPLPAGWYKCVITETEERTNKAQTGSYLLVTLEVIEGDHKGDKVFDRLNLDNPNDKARDIAQRALSAICRAVGVMTPRQSQELHDKPLMVKVEVKPGENGYGPSNNIKGYEAVNSSNAQAAPAASSSTPPWRR